MTLAHHDESADVVVIGGGPAGATASTLIAQHGRRVLLFERDRFPRFHIGESLIPCTYDVLDRLGMLPKLQSSRFVKKYSVQFVNQHGKLSEPFYFVEHRPHESSQTWQVFRQEFDAMMLDNAREHGVQVHEGARVLDVLFEGQRAVGVKAALEDGSTRTVRAAVVVDASGQHSMIMRRFNLRDWDPELKKAALWTYWENAFRDTGRDEGATVVLQTRGKAGWFWYIPLHNNIVSVGVVTDADALFKDRRGQHEVYTEQVESCPGLVPRLKGATQVGPYRSAREYSYRSRQAAGDGWVLVGDAYGFLDPLYSSGVLLALKSGQLAADAVVQGLSRGDLTAAQLGAWAPDFNRGMDRMRRLVVAYYQGLSFGRFIRDYPHLKGHITDLLIGDVFNDRVDELWPALDAFRDAQLKLTRAGGPTPPLPGGA